MGSAHSDLLALGDEERDLLRALDGSPRTLNEIAALIGRHPDVVDSMTDGLLAAGLLQSTERGELALTSDGLVASTAQAADPGAHTARITPYRDGPLVVRGPFRLVDQDGHEIEVTRSTVALCRCGRSRAKPFCDGTHKLAGFSAPSGPSSEPHLNLAPSHR